jgi:hypothetical protein
MDSEQISQLIRRQIGSAKHATNSHGVDIRKALVSPRLITVIERGVDKSQRKDRLREVWLVLVEDPDRGRGYRIVADKTGNSFGLATEGFPSDEHLVLVGWYGDFMTVFTGM